MSINGKAAGSLGKGTKPGIIDNKEWICQQNSIAKYWPFQWMVKESIAECWKASLGQTHARVIAICLSGICYSAVYPGLHEVYKFEPCKIPLIELKNKVKMFLFYH